jgi:hypothetical protein
MNLDDFFKMLDDYNLNLGELDSILQYYNMNGYDRDLDDFENTIRKMIFCFVGQLLDFKNKDKNLENYKKEVLQLFN